MPDSTGWLIQVVPDPDLDDKSRLDSLARNLRTAISQEADSASMLESGHIPPDAKGLAAVVGWIAVKLHAVDRAKRAARSALDWAVRNQRAVEIRRNGQVLKLQGLTAEQLDRFVEAWFEQPAS